MKMVYLLVSAVFGLSDAAMGLVLTVVRCGLLSVALMLRLPELIWRSIGGRASDFLFPDTSSSWEHDLFLDRAMVDIILGRDPCLYVNL
jgi:hypothetical protein